MGTENSRFRVRAQVSRPSSEPPRASLQSAVNRWQLRPGADTRSAARAGRRQCDVIARAVGITAARASHWRAQFLAAGQAGAGLKSRATDARDEDHRRLQAKIGELLMETELLYAKVDQLEASGPLARRRSTR